MPCMTSSGPLRLQARCFPLRDDQAAASGAFSCFCFHSAAGPGDCNHCHGAFPRSVYLGRRAHRSATLGIDGQIILGVSVKFQCTPYYSHPFLSLQTKKAQHSIRDCVTAPRLLSSVSLSPLSLARSLARSLSIFSSIDAPPRPPATRPSTVYSTYERLSHRRRRKADETARYHGHGANRATKTFYELGQETEPENEAHKGPE